MDEPMSKAGQELLDDVLAIKLVRKSQPITASDYLNSPEDRKPSHGMDKGKTPNISGVDHGKRS